MRIGQILAAAPSLGTTSGAALAQEDKDSVAGHFQVRPRGPAVLRDASAVVKVGGIDIGSSTHVTKSFVPEVEGTYFLSFDLKKLFLSTDIKAAGGPVRASADLNPWLVCAGAGVCC